MSTLDEILKFLWPDEQSDWEGNPPIFSIHQK